MSSFSSLITTSPGLSDIKKHLDNSVVKELTNRGYSNTDTAFVSNFACNYDVSNERLKYLFKKVCLGNAKLFIESCRISDWRFIQDFPFQADTPSLRALCLIALRPQEIQEADSVKFPKDLFKYREEELSHPYIAPRVQLHSWELLITRQSIRASSAPFFYDARSHMLGVFHTNAFRRLLVKAVKENHPPRLKQLSQQVKQMKLSSLFHFVIGDCKDNLLHLAVRKNNSFAVRIILNLAPSLKEKVNADKKLPHELSQDNECTRLLQKK